MIYTIKKGRHYSTNWVGMLLRCLTGKTNKNSLKAKVRFSKSCLVPSKDAEDVNKLFGLSFGWDHHQNSVRVGWRAWGETIQLFAYEYREGKREINHLCHVPAEQDVYIGLFLFDGITRYTVSIKEINCFESLHTGSFKPTKTKQRLYPYFGGTYPAPETMKIKIEWL